MFSKAIVRKPAPSLINGITTANLGVPDFELALEQHGAYVQALKDCGLEVFYLEPEPRFPDSTFVEDIALLTNKCAVITNPGAPSRQGEIEGLREMLVNHYDHIEQIQAPGTLEAGDVMMVGPHFYIGLSERTNREGAAQLITHLNKYGLTGSIVELNDVLHLKTGVAYLENNNLLASAEFLTHPDFKSFNTLPVIDSESYAANCIWVNEKVLIPQGYPETKKAIHMAGYELIELDVSEFRKLDGGLSCLSLRF